MQNLKNKNKTAPLQSIEKAEIHQISALSS
jgi:hypothetical protein